MKRRDFLANAAIAAPVATLAAGQVEASTEEDPAIAAVWDWIKASEVEGNYCTPDGMDWEDDPDAVALTEAFDAAYWKMATTAPTSAAGAALMTRALYYDRATNATGDARFNDTDTWNWEMLASWADQRDRVLVETITKAFASLSS